MNSAGVLPVLGMPMFQLDLLYLKLKLALYVVHVQKQIERNHAMWFHLLAPNDNDHADFVFQFKIVRCNSESLEP